MLQDAKHGQQVWFQMISRGRSMWRKATGCVLVATGKPLICHAGLFELEFSENGVQDRWKPSAFAHEIRHLTRFQGRFPVGRGFCNFYPSVSGIMVAFGIQRDVFGLRPQVWFLPVTLKTCKYWFQVEFPGIFGH